MMNRRILLGGLAAAGTAALARTAAAQAPSASTAPDAKMDFSAVKSEAQYRTALVGPAMLSLETSRIAMEKATNEKVRAFATFEFNEQNAIAFVLKDLGTTIPDMAAPETLILEETRSTPRGTGFDRAFLIRQIAMHEMLRDLHESYLRNTTGLTMTPLELHGRHIATLAQASISEHLTIARAIQAELRA